MQQLALRRRSFDPSLAEKPITLRKSMERKRRPLGFGKGNNTPHDDPNDPAAHSRQRRADVLADPRESVESTSSLAPPATRASESSRSDASSGGHVSFENPQRPSHPPR